MQEDIKTVNYDFLVIGHPRGGTGYLALLLRKFGYNVGHEKLLKNGISYWRYVIKTPKNTTFRYTIHLLRSPNTCIPSIMLENKYASGSYTYRQQNINRVFGIDLPGYKDTLNKKAIYYIELATLSFIFWHKLSSMKNPTHIINLESSYDLLKEFNNTNILKSDLPESYNSTKNKKNYKEHIKPTVDFDSIDTILKKILNSFCLKFNYPQMYNSLPSNPHDDLPKCVNEMCIFRSRDNNFIHCCKMCSVNGTHGPLCANKLFIPLFIKSDILSTLFTS
jgi:hypothetical protein